LKLCGLLFSPWLLLHNSRQTFCDQLLAFAVATIATAAIRASNAAALHAVAAAHYSMGVAA